MSKSCRVRSGVVLKPAGRSFQLDLISWGTIFVEESSQRKVFDRPVILENQAELSYGREILDMDDL